MVSSLVSVEPASLLRVPVPLMEISALPPVLVIIPASLVRVPATLMSPVLVIVPVLVRVFGVAIVMVPLLVMVLALLDQAMLEILTTVATSSLTQTSPTAEQ